MTTPNNKHIDQLKKKIEALEAKVKVYETANKESAAYTKTLENENNTLKTENEEMKTQFTAATRTLTDLSIEKNQDKTKINAQHQEIQELTAKYTEALLKLKTAEDKLNSKVSVVVVVLLPWIQRNSPSRLDVYSFYTLLTGHHFSAQDGHHWQDWQLHARHFPKQQVL